MRRTRKLVTRRGFLKALLAAGAVPAFVPRSALGFQGARPAASDRIVMGCIGIGGQGSGDMRSFLGFPEVQVVAVCDVVQAKRDNAKNTVDQKYGGQGCTAYNDFRQITTRPDIDAILIATPDHWHALIGMHAMLHGKDVYSEKPETLTVREGRLLVQAARRLGRVYSGGSQRVWGDYQWIHRMVRGGAIGQPKEVWVNCGGPSRDGALPEEPVPPGLDWDLWLGPAPYVPFNRAYLNFRPWRDYSGGGMTDWGAHNFGGAMFTCNVHETGPVEIIPPDGKNVQHLTYRYANGLIMHHGGSWAERYSMQGTEGRIPEPGGARRNRQDPPNIYIPNYKGRGGIMGDFLHCVKTREKPFRDIEVAHRTVTVCHLGNIAYWLKRPIKWDPDKEEIVGDPEASKWLSRPMRSPWVL